MFVFAQYGHISLRFPDKKMTGNSQQPHVDIHGQYLVLIVANCANVMETRLCVAVKHVVVLRH